MTGEAIQYSYTALLDVIGYRSRLAEDRHSGELAFKDALEAAMAVLTGINEAVFGYQVISDTIILTCSARDNLTELVGILKKVQIAFLKQCLFVRGGLTWERHFKSGAITYSPALAGAYEIEQRQAIVPRIVIDKNLIDMSGNVKEGELLKSGLVCDWNGVSFVHIIDDGNKNDMYEFARALYDRDREALAQDESAFFKHYWFQQYLLAFLPGNCEPYITGPSRRT